MSARRTIWEWSTSYVGDPSSWERRGELIYHWLEENGLRPEHHVLDIGCGNLSDGYPLIRALDAGRFVGIEPNGWLVEAGLQQFPEIEVKRPEFLWRTDFDASELGRRFDFIVAHSILSHCAHWQLGQLLANTRKVVDEGAVFLCSFIGDQFNGWSEDWAYPGVNKFRLQTVIAEGVHAGWRVEMRHDYRERMMAECPNDSHDWLKLTAVPSLAELNERRLAEEAMQSLEREVRDADEAARIAALEAEDEARRSEVGL